MPASAGQNDISFTMKDVEQRMIQLRGQMVIIDRDVAELYGVGTKRINEAVRNNPEKFPEGYTFTLQQAECQWVVENFVHLSPIQFSSNGTKAFTEKGLYMIATILKSPQATKTTINIIEAYSRMKELGRTITSLTMKENASEKKALSQKAGTILSGLLTNDMEISEEEFTVEVNLMAFKLSKTVKKTKKE